ncbi:hypothetical protein TP2_09585 [Thioclava pacifica DSM 10166]|uniref:Uncharacterized protein n=1 Tax=Thioclava pacifica DSM 10166 TaxID=1353537 RepID=A0A074J783_9RHOB|nr:hypothetical protein TP2_09585 [Thioclava pacifica DSM 10166]
MVHGAERDAVSLAVMQIERRHIERDLRAEIRPCTRLNLPAARRIERFEPALVVMPSMSYFAFLEGVRLHEKPPFSWNGGFEICFARMRR